MGLARQKKFINTNISIQSDSAVRMLIYVLKITSGNLSKSTRLGFQSRPIAL